jgi:hypothetical protein
MIRLLVIALAIAGVYSQTEEGIIRRVSAALSSGSSVFQRGKTEGICRCGDGANTPQCKDAIVVSAQLLGLL